MRAFDISGLAPGTTASCSTTANVPDEPRSSAPTGTTGRARRSTFRAGSTAWRCLSTGGPTWPRGRLPERPRVGDKPKEQTREHPCRAHSLHRAGIGPRAARRVRPGAPGPPHPGRVAPAALLAPVARELDRPAGGGGRAGPLPRDVLPRADNAPIRCFSRPLHLRLSGRGDQDSQSQEHPRPRVGRGGLLVVLRLGRLHPEPAPGVEGRGRVRQHRHRRHLRAGVCEPGAPGRAGQAGRSLGGAGGLPRPGGRAYRLPPLPARQQHRRQHRGAVQLRRLVEADFPIDVRRRSAGRGPALRRSAFRGVRRLPARVDRPGRRRDEPGHEGGRAGDRLLRGGFRFGHDKQLAAGQDAGLALLGRRRLHRHRGADGLRHEHHLHTQ
jgi:hypothetical protein